ncbi:RNA polymerase sigma factor SigW [Numidum massiliense]|uniref:RNA polymerase sigma factor SigW n=1 Tax=Numidum massiliense TaxID=1522315 RepID=UPI0006D55D50|nr:RNA polymerase sigma factor SigW [Numidum massiliense]
MQEENKLEALLIQRAVDGDETAFIGIVEQYKDKIYYLSLRMLRSAQDAEEIAQETFLRVYKNLDRFDPQRKFSTWIYRIATNLCIDHIRKRKAHYSLDDSIGDDDGEDWYSRQESSEPTPEESLMSLELRTKVKDAIEELPAHYKAAIVLRYFHDMTLAEIGEVLSLPVSTVKTRVHRARESLRKVLGSL